MSPIPPEAELPDSTLTPPAAGAAGSASAPAPVPAAPVPPPSAFARVGLVLYALLIVYASWFPFAGWRDLGVPPLSYLSQPLPHYWTKFDFITNLVGYMPIGLLGVLALYPLVRGLAALAGITMWGVLLSGLMEAIQTYLPSRVPSNLDLISNGVGVFIGALLGLLLAHRFLVNGRLVETRRRWFTAAAGRGLMVLSLWPLAQIAPQGYLFGHGQVLPILSDWVGDLLERPVDLSALLRHSRELTVEQYWLSETIITACGLAGAMLTLFCMMRERAPRMLLVTILFVAVIGLKALGSALQFSPDNAFIWLTPGAQGGLLLGFVMLSGLIYAPPVAQRRVAGLTLLISLAVVNVVPANPYFLATLQTWVQGKFINFNGATQFLSLLWPFLALWFLYHPVHRRVRTEKAAGL